MLASHLGLQRAAEGEAMPARGPDLPAVPGGREAAQHPAGPARHPGQVALGARRQVSGDRGQAPWAAGEIPVPGVQHAFPGGR